MSQDLDKLIDLIAKTGKCYVASNVYEMVVNSPKCKEAMGEGLIEVIECKFLEPNTVMAIDDGLIPMPFSSLWN